MSTEREMPAVEMVTLLLDLMGQPCPRRITGDEIITRLAAASAAQVYADGHWSRHYRTMHKVWPVVVGVDFRWCGVPDYRSAIDYRGIDVHVFHPSGRPSVPAQTITDAGAIESTLDALGAAADTLCVHVRSAHVRRLANALNEYRCLDCGMIYALDSSG